ncbi:MAG: competence protein TfoX [Roseburia sp.]|nr:competence protein TfoX [Roseburia sp.]
MASSEQYYNRVSERLSNISGITYRKVMGEYIVSMYGKAVGVIYGDRLYVRATKSARKLMPSVKPIVPYDGSRRMLCVDDDSDGLFLAELIKRIYDDIPPSRRRGRVK